MLILVLFMQSVEAFWPVRAPRPHIDVLGGASAQEPDSESEEQESRQEQERGSQGGRSIRGKKDTDEHYRHYGDQA